MCNHYVFTGSLKSLSFHQNPLLPAQQTHRLKKSELKSYNRRSSRENSVMIR